MSLSTLINSSFKKALFTGSNNEEIIQAYCGGLNTETVHSLCSELEKTLKRNKFPKLIIKRTFFLSLEVIQNQLLHGSTDNGKLQYTYFICSVNENDICIHACNLIRNEECDPISERINHINELLIEKNLQAHYLEQLNNDSFNSKGGGGLGFIKMALVTGNTIGHEIVKGNSEYSFLSVCLKLSHATLDNTNNINFEEILSLLK